MVDPLEVGLPVLRVLAEHDNIYKENTSLKKSITEKTKPS